MKKIRKLLHLFWIELTWPYPFQLWAAPRKKKWCFSRPEAEPKRKSPPGFSFKRKDKTVEYAMYLYPDSIHTYWLIYFFISVPLHMFMDCCFIVKGVVYYKYIAGFFLFIISYCLIYIYGREPVLDDLWILWADTEQQKKYFKNIPSKITFDSCQDMKKYEGLEIRFDLRGKDSFREKYKYIINFICIFTRHSLGAAKLLSLESFLFRRCVFMKSNYYTKSPVFFNPQGSIQEGLLRAAIADFFAVEKKSKFALNIFVYFIPHVLVSFCYLLLNLLCAFRYHPYNNQKETISLVVLIVVWAFVSIFVLYKQYISIKLFYDMDKKLFSFSPKNVEDFAASKNAKKSNFYK